MPIPDKPYRILVTGSRSWPEELAWFVDKMLRPAIASAQFGGQRVIVVEGECPHGGVDLYARRAAEYWDVEVEPHPAEVVGGRILGPARNSCMVQAGADICFAFPAPGSRGTIDCLLKAIRAGIPTFVYPLDEARREAARRQEEDRA